MRWPVLLQAALGVFALFGFAFLAVEPKIGTLVDSISEEQAQLEARVAVLEVERAWSRSRRALERAAAALAQSPTFKGLGEAVPAARRRVLLEQALQDTVKQFDRSGRAVLVDSEGSALAGAALLAASGAVNDAHSGVVSVRVEMIGDEYLEVVAVPVPSAPRPVPSPRSSRLPRRKLPKKVKPKPFVGVLALARPLDRLRLSSWASTLPSSTTVSILDGTDLVASLASRDQVQAVRPEKLPKRVEVDEQSFAVEQQRLAIEPEGNLRIVALTPLGGLARDLVVHTVYVLVGALAATTFLLMVTLLVLAPARSSPPVSTSASVRPSSLEDDGLGGGASTAAMVATVSSGLPPSLNQPELERSLAPQPSADSLRMDPFGTYRGIPEGTSERLPTASGIQVDVPPSNTVNHLTDSVPAVATPYSPDRGAASSDGGLAETEERHTGREMGARARRQAAPTTMPRDVMPMSDSSFSAPRSVFELPLPPEQRADAESFLASGSPPGTDGGYFAESPSAFQPSSAAAQPFGNQLESWSSPTPWSAAAAHPEQRDVHPASSAGGFAGEGLSSEMARELAMGSNVGNRDQLSDEFSEDNAEWSDPGPLSRWGTADLGGPAFPDEEAEPESGLSFDAIAKAAQASSPAFVEPDANEDLPVPKGGLSPGMIAGQGFEYQGHVMAPSPRLEDNLPLPKEQASQLYDLAPSSSSDVDRILDPGRAAPSGSPGLSSSPGSELDAEGGIVAYDVNHYRLVFEEFVAAKTRLGEPIEGLSFEGFGAKLQLSEEGLIEQHRCRAVRFQVIVNDRTVSLRPQLIR